ncbi:hypothetical protein K438DRAFT_2085143 [Mycena galopus ATCC 62051]|nr:hypothetical protein K438DRAFT_2085143 [Mycena galopus ATCC 62051]
MDYYQLGGFNAAVYCYRPKDLGKKVYYHLLGNRRNLELVLGIKKSGTSHLLLTRDERNNLFSLRDVRVGDLQSSANEFESLSPIVFHDVNELEAKLDALQPKPKSNRDDSRLNKAYQGTQSGVDRGQFENARVLQRDVDRHKLHLVDTSWAASVRVLSFCYNIWLPDSRSLADRRHSPKVLDLGWCEAWTPTLDSDTKKMSRHIIYSTNQNLQNPNKNEKKENDKSNKSDVPPPRTPYEYEPDYGKTEVCDPQTVAQKVRDTFQSPGPTTKEPVLLLVHNQQTALDVLKSLDVDMSNWCYSLKDLLRDTRASPSPQANDPRKAPGFSREAYHDPRGSPGYSRRRSASPRRGDDRARRRDPSPPPPRQYAPVYVVDLQTMFLAVFGTKDGSDSVLAMVERMAEVKAKFLPKGECAGNECWYLVEMFRQMVMRGAIDEQKNEWTPMPQVVSDNPAFDEDQSDYGDSDSD